MKRSVVALVLALVACGHQRPGQNGADASGGGVDGTAGGVDARTWHDAASGIDGSATGHDAGVDGSTAHDAAVTPDAPSGGIITGGPCISGTSGATAYRVRFANGGGTAYAVYEVNGLPDHSRDHTEAYGYQIGFTPSFVDPYLGDGGVQLDDSDFIDVEISTAGVTSISRATLSIYGRSYNTTASGSFNWQTFDGTGATATDFVSNVAPYQWYSADMTTEIGPGENGVLLRIKSGPSSDALVVNRIELCLVAQ
jgi:hypothetical protein